MKRKKKSPSGYTDEPETVEMSTGWCTGFMEVPKNDRKIKPQIGFIRSGTSTPNETVSRKSNKKKSLDKIDRSVVE